MARLLKERGWKWAAKGEFRAEIKATGVLRNTFYLLFISNILYMLLWLDPLRGKSFMICWKIFSALT